MKIEIDFNTDSWHEFARGIPEDDYVILEEYWEDQDEWAIIEVTSQQWKSWIRTNHPEWILDGS
jgi:hypothetical protein